MLVFKHDTVWVVSSCPATTPKNRRLFMSGEVKQACIYDTCALHKIITFSSNRKSLFHPWKAFSTSVCTLYAGCIRMRNFEGVTKKFSCFVNAGLMPNRNGKRSIYFTFLWRGLLWFGVSCYDLFWWQCTMPLPTRTATKWLPWQR